MNKIGMIIQMLKRNLFQFILKKQRNCMEKDTAENEFAEELCLSC